MTAERNTHLVVFVHGWMGNGDDMRYVRTTMEDQAKEEDNLVCYTSTCQHRKTHDGIKNGGLRLAHEVSAQVRKINGPVALSFIGHSLGGMYARCALPHLEWSRRVTPRVFCTIATPHLGVDKENLFYYLFRKPVGKLMGPTIRDLLLQTPIINDMGTMDKYLGPLSRFEKRIALANAFKTDFLVPTVSAAFLSSRTVHDTLNNSNSGEAASHYALSVKTQEVPTDFHTNDMSKNLDALGWTKQFLDLRDAIPLPAIKNPFNQESVDSSSSFDHGSPTSKPKWTSQEIIYSFDRIGTHWKLPLAHPMACASQKRRLNRRLAEHSKPIMDQLAHDVLLCSGQRATGASSCEEQSLNPREEITLAHSSKSLARGIIPSGLPKDTRATSTVRTGSSIFAPERPNRTSNFGHVSIEVRFKQEVERASFAMILVLSTICLLSPFAGNYIQ